ncbi:hypothetical protein DL96DRAFT_1712415 [Flagelloscypha sp. PMI_526]|nr:hypothetical protein DL96DRAFT_1712415 [Flagelloscypha sp. PMI_526]
MRFKFKSAHNTSLTRTLITPRNRRLRLSILAFQRPRCSPFALVLLSFLVVILSWTLLQSDGFSSLTFTTRGFLNSSLKLRNPFKGLESMSNPPVPQSEAVESTETETPLLALPGIPSSPADGSAPTQLEVNNQISLDALGPLVVNPDGSLSRISNWDQMTEGERKNTMRVIARRNKERMDALKEQEQQ